MEFTAQIFLYFFIYAVMGWIWETIYCSLKNGKFVYRGFLKGPYCPIYGFGMLLVLYLVTPVKETTLDLFVFSAIACSILEYITGYLLERVFKVTLWNYDDMPMNIEGKIALPVSLFWGFCCVVVVKRIHPEVTEWVNWIYGNYGTWPSFVLMAVMAVDTVFSIIHMSGFEKTMKQLSEKLEELKANFEEQSQNADQRMEQIKMEMRSKYPLKRYNNRLINRYPRIKMRDLQDFDNLKETFSNKKISKKA